MRFGLMTVPGYVHSQNAVEGELGCNIFRICSTDFA